LNYTFSQHLKSLINTSIIAKNKKDAVTNANRKYCGVAIRQAYFTPTFSKFENNISDGIDIYVTDPNCFCPFRLVLDILITAHSMAGGATYDTNNNVNITTSVDGINNNHGGTKFEFLENNFIDLLTGSNFTRLAILDAEKKWTTDLILEQYNDQLINSYFYKKHQQYLLYNRNPF
jgi:uncharacterized protein YbbC (DUF1343 family)